LLNSDPERCRETIWVARSPRTSGRLLMSVEDEAKHAFDSSFNCAESVLLVVSKRVGLEKERAGSLIPKIATGFGGGIARNGDVCGALCGGVMAISLVLGRNRSDESREPCYSAVDRFYNDFVNAFGTCKCRELVGVNLKTPEGNEAYRSRLHRERCTPIVEWAAVKASKLINESKTR
jgi:C_GCAxxG_C_C family probable redox protein